jgi:hypothetical protein
MSDWKVDLVEDNISEFYVEFAGPKESEFVSVLCSADRLTCGMSSREHGAAACCP